MKTYSIILTILAIILLAIIFWPPSPSNENQSLLNQRDESELQVARKQKIIDSIQVEVDILKAKLVDSNGKVKRSEDKLTKSLSNEKVYLKVIKQQTRLMSNIQADSALIYRFRNDPDSVTQKVLFELARLDQCDSIRENQSETIQAFQDQSLVRDSLEQAQSEVISQSQSIIQVQNQSSEIADKVIKNQDTEIKKLKRRNKVLKILTPVAVVLTVLIFL